MEIYLRERKLTQNRQKMYSRVAVQYVLVFFEKTVVMRFVNSIVTGILLGLNDYV